MTKIKKVIAVIFACFITVFMLSGCSGGGTSKSNYAPEAVNMSDNAGNIDNSAVSEKGKTSEKSNNMDIEAYSNKLIYRASLSLYASDINNSDAQVKNMIQNFGGYVSSYRNSEDEVWIEARIPSDKFFDFVNNEELSKKNRVEKSISSEDITLQYSDNEAEIETLHIEEQRLMDYLSKAENVSDMMTIENSLSGVRGKIKSAENQKRTYDSYLSYSEVDIHISHRYVSGEEVSFFEKIKGAFIGSWHNIVNWLEGLLIVIIYLFPFGLLAIPVVWVVNKVVKNKKKKNKKNIQLSKNTDKLITSKENEKEIEQ